MREIARTSVSMGQRRRMDPAPLLLVALWALIWSIGPYTKPSGKARRTDQPPQICWTRGLAEPAAHLIAPFGLPSKVGFSLPEESNVNLQGLLDVPEMAPHLLPGPDTSLLQPAGPPPDGFPRHGLTSAGLRPATRAFALPAPAGRSAHLVVEASPSLSRSAFSLDSLSEEDLKQFDKSFHVVIYVEMNGDGRLANAWVETSSGNPAVDLAVIRLLARSSAQKAEKSVSGRVSLSYAAP